jgi:hypothetical protein
LEHVAGHGKVNSEPMRGPTGAKRGAYVSWLEFLGGRLLQREHLEFHWDANNEGLIWTEDGHPLQGLTGGGERRNQCVDQLGPKEAPM